MSDKEDSINGGTSNDLETSSKDVVDNFQSFYESTNFPDAIEAFSKVLKGVDIKPGPFQVFFPKFKSHLQPYLPYKYQTIWDVLENKSKLKVYGNGIASKHSVLVVGAGPCGLRTALETQFLGATTIIVESRKDFTRNNVLKLWKFLIEDLKSLGFKSFYSQFCIGDINHISIKNLQLVLSKICLMVGINIANPVKFLDICSPNISGNGWTAKFDPELNEMSQYTFDMIFVASGKNVPKNIDGFDRHSLNAPLSIAVTGNFVNQGTKEEQSVKEISGLSKQYDQEFFASIEKDTGISLENIVYYKGETHYFVMTATRESLLKRGVLMGAAGDRASLFSAANVNKDNLHKYVTNAAQYSTKYLSKRLPTQEFAIDHTGNPDVAVFDFTNLYYAKRASCVKEDMGYTLVMAAVGDSLLEPFWPEGTGCARGFLSSMNAAWMLRRLAEGIKISEITEEREKLYKVLKQTTDDPGGDVLKDDHASYTIDPKTRYKNAPQLMHEIKAKHISRKYDVDKESNCVTESQIQGVQKSREDRTKSVSDTRKLFDQKRSSLQRQTKKKETPGSANTDQKKRESSENSRNTSKFPGKILSCGKRKGKETQTSMEDNRYDTQEKPHKNPRKGSNKMNFINKIRRKRKGCEKDTLQENGNDNSTSGYGANTKNKRFSNQASKESDNTIIFRNGGDGEKQKNQPGDNKNKRVTVANRTTFFEKLDEEAKQTDINRQRRPKFDEVDGPSKETNKRKSQKPKCTIL